MVESNYDVQRTNPSIKNLSVKISIDERRVGIIHSKDLVECYFIEDIFSFNMYGKLVFYDQYGLIEQGPLTGNEMISLVYGVEELREVVFHIWKLKRIVQVADVNPTDTALIEIYFVDSSHYKMTVPKYSRSFATGQKHTDVVKHLLVNNIGWSNSGIQLEASSSSLTDNFVIPYWNTATAIKWILKRAVGQTSGTAGYICYNNTYKQLAVNVRTLNWLFSENNYVDDTDYLFENDDEGAQNKIWEWWLEGADHNTTGLIRGGKFRGFNSAQKKLLTTEYKFSDGIRETVLNGQRSLFSDISDLNATQLTYGEPNENDLKAVLYSDWIRSYSMQNMLTAIVQGNEKRYAGHQVRIKWASVDKVEQLWQKQLEGKYLVKSITHNFTGRATSNINYMQRITFIKNAYTDSDAQSLLNATKTNLTGGKRQRIILPV